MKLVKLYQIFSSIKLKIILILFLGLATGSTPIETSKKIIKKANEDNISFQNIKTFNLDEYLGIDKENKQSYRYFMKENLFKFFRF